MTLRSRRLATSFSAFTVAGLLLAWLFYDPPLRPEVQARMAHPHPFDASPGNGFLIVAGMGQPQPLDAGQVWVAQLQQHLAQGRHAPWPSLPEPATHPANSDPGCHAINQRCFEVPPALSPAVLRQAEDYQRLLEQPAYDEFVDALLADVAAPLPAYAPLARAQQAFHARAAQPGLAADPLLEALLLERGGLTRMLRGSHTLIGKMIALSMAQRHDFFVHDALRAGRLPLQAPGLAMLKQPFDAEASDITPALLTELQAQLLLVDRLYATQTDPFAAADESSSSPIARWPLAWQRVAQRALFKRNATLNRMHHRFMSTAMLAQDATPPSSEPDGWVVNPIGVTLADMAAPAYASYHHRARMLHTVHDALAQCRATQAAMVTVDWPGTPADRKRLEPRLDGDQLRC